MKRGDVSIGVIVGLAIALIVLILIMTLLITRFNLFGKGTGELQTGTEARLCSKQGSCNALPCPPGKAIAPVPSQGWIDCSANCCKP